MKEKSKILYKKWGVNNRDTKISRGMMFTHERSKKSSLFDSSRASVAWNDPQKMAVTCLLVHGTTDKRFYWGWTKKVMKEHELDRGYFKQVLVLSDSGRSRLKMLRAKRKIRNEGQ